jgi:hypothetical protein
MPFGPHANWGPFFLAPFRLLRLVREGRRPARNYPPARAPQYARAIRPRAAPIAVRSVPIRPQVTQVLIRATGETQGD